MNEIDLVIHSFALDLTRKDKRFRVFNWTDYFARHESDRIIFGTSDISRKRIDLSLGRVVLAYREVGNVGEAQQTIKTILEIAEKYPVREIDETIHESDVDFQLGTIELKAHKPVAALTLLFLESASRGRDLRVVNQKGKVLRVK